MAAYEFNYDGKTYLAEYEDGARINGIAKDKYVIWWERPGDTAYERVTSTWSFTL
jgi:hypothetical protein